MQHPQYAPLTPEQLSQLVDIRNGQIGFPAYMGIHVDEITLGGAVVSMDLDNPNYVNSSGTTIHGGVIFTLADVASGCAIWSSGFVGATTGADIHYVAPVLSAKRLIATATALQFGKRMYVFKVTMSDETGRIVAHSTFSYVTLNKRILGDSPLAEQV